MSFEKHVDQIKRIRDYLEKQSPRNREGEIVEPFLGWIKRLARDIKRAKGWTEGNDEEAEEKGDHGDSEPTT